MPGHLFLLEKISGVSGIFVFDGRIAFAQASTSNNGAAICTSLVEFQPSLEIKSVTNDPSFKSGLYDFLILKSLDSKEIAESFLNIVRLYGNNPSMPFDDFIHSVVELFQLPRQQAELDCIGLFGELSFIRCSWKAGKDISPYWHLHGVYSKYDFSSKNSNFEVKTSSTDSTSFIIKHSQIFNGDNNIVVLVSIRNEEAMGVSLKELVNYFKSTEPFASNLAFQLSLEKELFQKIEPAMFEKRYAVSGIYGFKTDWLETIKTIPECISDVSYRYTFNIGSSLPVNILVGLF